MNILKKIVYFPIEVTLLGLLVGVSLFAYSHQMTDTQILPKWLISCLVAFVIGVIGPMKKIFRIPIGFSLCHASRVIFVCCIVQSLYFLYLYAGSHMQHVSGNFDNPAGFASAMCAGFPFALYVTKHWKLPRFNWLMWGGVLLMVVTTVLSGSRSGLLGIFVVAGLWTWQAIRCSGKLKTVLLCAFFIVMLVVCYFIRKDSADGRLLIWQCSWEMIKDAPITGYGVGGFKKHYMDYQA